MTARHLVPGSRRIRFSRLALTAIAAAFFAVPVWLPSARAADAVGTDRLATPAEPASPDAARKRFIPFGRPSSKPSPSHPPPPPSMGPILDALQLKGHTESPPSTTIPLKPGRAQVNPPPP